MTDLTDQAVAALGQGLVIAYPTETVFGLGVDPFNQQAVSQLVALKGRQASKGFILLIPDVTWIDTLAQASPTAHRLMAHYWPGPLTLVMPALPSVPGWITGGRGTVALRLSPHPVVAHLLTRWNAPLVSTSANLTGEAELTDDRGVRRQWQDQVAVVLAGRSGAAPSTVLQVDFEKITVLREGVLPSSTIFQFLAQPPPFS